MKIYLAAAFTRKAEIQQVAKMLEEVPGLVVCSRWSNEPIISPEWLKATEKKAEFPEIGNKAIQIRRSQEDLDDVEECDVFVRFTDQVKGMEFVPTRLVTGTRLVEFGYAMKAGKVLIVVGGQQPLFDVLPSIIHVEDADDLKKVLTSMREIIR